MLSLPVGKENVGANGYEPRVGLDDRKLARLPVDKSNLEQWERLGIVWREKLQDITYASSLKISYLPQGWNLKTYSVGATVPQTLLFDNNLFPRALIIEKSEWFDSYSGVRFLGWEESVRKRAEFFNKEKRLMLEQRYETWSETSPFTVIYIKDISDVFSGFIRHPKKYSFQGFFENEETANDAKGLLEVDADARDLLLVQKISIHEFEELTRDGYKIANGFADKDWYFKF